MSTDGEDFRDRLLLDWAVRYGPYSLPTADNQRTRTALIGFAEEVLGAQDPSKERIDEIVLRYSRLVG